MTLLAVKTPLRVLPSFRVSDVTRLLPRLIESLDSLRFVLFFFPFFSFPFSSFSFSVILTFSGKFFKKYAWASRAEITENSWEPKMTLCLRSYVSSLFFRGPIALSTYGFCTESLSSKHQAKSIPFS